MQFIITNFKQVCAKATVHFRENAKNYMLHEGKIRRRHIFCWSLREKPLVSKLE